MSGLVVGECSSCGARRFPRPLWCDVCWSDSIKEVTVSSGKVSETTVVRHAVGRRLGSVRLGTVRLTGGGVVIARLQPAVAEGNRVDIVVEDGAPVARQPQG
jgi:uncharacterized OB-fold protein